MIRFSNSLGLIAVGAIIAFAIGFHSRYLDLRTAGVIIMLAGGALLLLRLLTRPRVDPEQPLSKADLVAVDERTINVPEVVVQPDARDLTNQALEPGARPEQEMPPRQGERVVPTEPRGSTRPAPRSRVPTTPTNWYDDAPSEPHVYSITGRPVDDR